MADKNLQRAKERAQKEAFDHFNSLPDGYEYGDIEGDLISRVITPDCHFFAIIKGKGVVFVGVWHGAELVDIHIKKMPKMLIHLHGTLKRFIELRKKIKGGAIDALIAQIKTISLDHTRQASDNTRHTITLETIRTSAGIFRRVGSFA